MPLEHSNSYELENPVKKTGNSESKEYKNPSNDLNEINQREKIKSNEESIKKTLAERETLKVVIKMLEAMSSVK